MKPIKDREIVRGVSWMLAIKVFFVVLIGLLFFGPSDRLSLTGDTVSEYLFPAPATVNTHLEK